jgi:hypothetical protein
MYYFELINRFWQCNNERPIGCNATALYFYLVKVCNSLGWKATFKHSDRYISIQLGISVNTVRNAKNRLKQLGLIDFKSPEKASRGLDGATSFSFKTVSNFNTVTDTVPDTRNKPNKTKEANIINATVVAKTPKPEVDISIRNNKFYEDCAKYVEKYGKEMVRDFFEYWTETNKSGKKMRFEDQKFFDLSKRLATWNNKSFNHGKNRKTTKASDTEDKDFLNAVANGLARGISQRDELV